MSVSTVMPTFVFCLFVWLIAFGWSSLMFLISLRATERKVCQQASAMAKQVLPPFYTLNPGDCFVTQFGVVQVVKDDRATPTGSLPKDIKNVHRKYHGVQTNFEKRMTKRPMGLTAKAKDSEQSVVEKLGGIEVEDLSRFGLIPEFIGRLPVNALLQELDEDLLPSRFDY